MIETIKTKQDALDKLKQWKLNEDECENEEHYGDRRNIICTDCTCTHDENLLISCP